MIRILLTIVIPLALPTLVYMGWLYAERRRRKAESDGVPAPWYSNAPWLRLGLMGVVLTTIVLGVLATLGGGPRDAVYTPPRLEDGRIIPGDLAPPTDNSSN